MKTNWEATYQIMRTLVDSNLYPAFGKSEKKTQSLAETIGFHNGSEGEIEKRVLEIVEDPKNQEKDAKKMEFAKQLAYVAGPDAKILKFTLETIFPLLSQAIKEIPSNDREFCEVTMKKALDEKGKASLTEIILNWDNTGTEKCLEAERSIINKAFKKLKEKCREQEIDEDDQVPILTAFAQEFERRASQKRKTRAGHSLETSLDIILEHFHCVKADKPVHFAHDLEIDRWVNSTKRQGWKIGISCKRTLRERWKTMGAADLGKMGEHKITEIWHIVTHTSDIKETILRSLGKHNHKFYVPDQDPLLEKWKNDPVMGRYLRPLTSLVDTLTKEVGHTP